MKHQNFQKINYLMMRKKVTNEPVVEVVEEFESFDDEETEESAE